MPYDQRKLLGGCARMTIEPGPLFHRTVSDPYEVDLLLDRLFGLQRSVFVEAVRRGDNERRIPRADDAPGADGYYAYNRTLAALRINARKTGGWHRGSFRNIPVTLNEDETVAIAVSSADERTGKDGDPPSTKNIKGEDATVAIDGNVLRNDECAPFDDAPVDFYYLLYFMTDEGIWAEIAEPTYKGADGRIVGWGWRLLLGETHLDGERGKRRQGSPVAPTTPATAIDVAVTRKTA
jgi:hypothetical protein